MTVPRGFSILELVVVIVIAGILAALAIPHFTDSETKARFYHEQVMATVRFAQRQAVAQRRNVYICVQAAAIQVDYVNTCAGATSPPPSAGGALLQVPQQLIAPSGVSLSSTATPFSFNALGQPSPIGGVTITVIGAGKSVNVTGETGYVFPS